MLEIQDLRKTYPGFELKCSLSVPNGRITGVIGQNGAGKSTLFKAILRLIRCDSGKITLLGKDITAIEETDMMRIGSVMGESSFSGYLSILDIEKIMRTFYPRFQSEWFVNKCREYGLPLDQPIRGFSTGMAAKLKILQAVSYGADFLILDEPTAGLDVAARDDILSLLRDYMKENEERSILISSHISADLETLCDDFYMIHKGKIVLHEDTDRLLSDYAILKVPEEAYEALDKRYVLRTTKESYGRSCLVSQRQYYQENNPNIVMEKTGIDQVILQFIKGEDVQ